jgi:polar amino acid transport system substrate-binding protein
MRNRRPIGENSGEILRAVYVRLNIAVEFEDVPGKRALALSSAGEIQRIANLAPRLPLADSDLAADHYIEPSASRRPLISMCRLPAWDPRLDWR